MDNPGDPLLAQANDYNTVGIDLGTTYSTISYFTTNRIIENGKETAMDGHDTPYIPSMVCNLDHVVVGTNAYMNRFHNRNCTLYDSKLFIGKRFADQSVQELINNYPFPIVEGDNGRAAFKVAWQGQEEIIYPEQVSAMVIQYLCGLVEKRTKCRVEYVVVSVPASFNADERACTQSAVKMAGRKLLAMIDEPSAAAISFTSRNVTDDKTILVYDLGGGTFDVSIMRKQSSEYKVLGVDGDIHFGGRNLDLLVFEEVLRKIRDQDPSFELTEVKKEAIMAQCEELKINISVTEQNGEIFEFSFEDESYQIVLSYDELENMFLPHLERTMEKVRSCLDQTHLMPNDIDLVILIGGSSNWPGVRKIIRNMFDEEKILVSDDPRLAVSRGTLIYASTHFNAGLVTPILEVRELPSEAEAGIMVPLSNDPSQTDDLDAGLVVPSEDREDSKTKEHSSPPGLVVPIRNVVIFESISDEDDDENRKESVSEKRKEKGPSLSDTEKVVNTQLRPPLINPVSQQAKSNPFDKSSTALSDFPPAPSIPKKSSNFSMKLKPERHYLKVSAKNQYLIKQDGTIMWSHDLNGYDREPISEDRRDVIVSNNLNVDLDEQKFNFTGKEIRVCVENGSIVLYSQERIQQTGPFVSSTPLPPLPPPAFLHPVLPLSIGVEVSSGRMSVIIPKNSPLPAMGEKEFRANISSPTVIETKLYQGSNLEVCRKNHELGILKASGLTPSSDGRAHIIMKVRVDEMGCVDFFYYQMGQKESRCPVYHNVVLNKEKLEELQQKIDDWWKNGEEMEQYKLIYLDTAALLENYRTEHGDDQRVEYLTGTLKSYRISVPSELTNDRIQKMDDLRGQIRKEMNLSN